MNPDMACPDGRWSLRPGYYLNDKAKAHFAKTIVRVKPGPCRDVVLDLERQINGRQLSSGPQGAE